MGIVEPLPSTDPSSQDSDVTNTSLRTVQSKNSIETTFGRIKDMCTHLKDDLVDVHAEIKPDYPVEDVHEDTAMEPSEKKSNAPSIEEIHTHLEQVDSLFQSLIILKTLIKRVLDYVKSERGLSHKKLKLEGRISRSKSSAGDIRRAHAERDIGKGISLRTTIRIRAVTHS